MEDILGTSPGKRLEEVSWKMSLGGFLEEALRTFPGRLLEDVSRRRLENVSWKTS